MTMRAAVIERYGGPEVFALVDLPRPSFGARDVLVRVHATSVNPVDCKQRQGIQRVIVPKRMPAILGMDVSGVVEEIGAQVTRFAVGDAVWSSPTHRRPGTYAELVAIAEHELAPKPSNLSHAEAAALPLVALTAWECLVVSGRLQRGQRVLIEAGSGGVGTVAIQIARHLGAHVITTCSSRNTELVTGLGAHEVIDYRSVSYQDVLSGIDLVLSSMGPTEWGPALAVTKRGGVVTSISTGLPDAAKRHGPWLAPLVIAFWMARGGLRARLQGKRLSHIVRRASGEKLAAIGALVESGVVVPVLDRVVPLAGIAEAHAYSDSGRARGKIVIQVAG